MDNLIFSNVRVGEKETPALRVAEAEITDKTDGSKFYICLVWDGTNVEITDTEHSIFNDMVMNSEGVADGQMEEYIALCGGAKTFTKNEILQSEESPWGNLYQILLTLAENNDKNTVDGIGSPLSKIQRIK